MIMTDFKASNQEYKQVIRNFRVAAGISIAAILIGAVFYRRVEDLSWIDSIYLCVITLTTVGYGDITPQTDAGKIFTIFYILTGIGIIATMINLSVKRAWVKRRR